MPIYKVGKQHVDIELEGIRQRLGEIGGRIVFREAVERDPAYPDDEVYVTKTPFVELLDVEAKGPNSYVAMSLFPDYAMVDNNRLRLLGGPSRPGTTIYATYRKA